MASFTDVFDNLTLNEDRFVGLITNLISVSKQLQNNPAQGLIPQEDLASDFVLEVLKPYMKENGGPLEIERVTFVEGRGNVIIKYPGTTDEVVSFIGSHLDVVPADPKNWDEDPFVLRRDGDLIYGRGTTDCLGHVAMLTDFFASLAEARPVLKQSIVGVFIANEENGTFKGIGVDQLSLEGYLDDLKKGPVYWIDAADSQPCQGTCGVMTWKMETHGKLFHSGMPNRTVNPIEMSMDALGYIQNVFYTKFARDPREDLYNYTTCSTMKPTQIRSTEGSLNQIPPMCTIEGDCRVSPFYDVKDVKRALEEAAATINADPQGVLAEYGNQFHGPHSKYAVPSIELKGRVEMKVNDGENGIACNLDSPGFKALVQATGDVLGSVEPYSIGGSLPLVRDMQDDGFDIQIAGYGFAARYHADNECASIAALGNATKIISRICSMLEAQH